MTHHAITCFVLCTLAAHATAQQTPNAQPWTWTDATKLGLEGQGFKKLQDPYDRLPESSARVVSKTVWSLSKDSSGLVCRFRTDSPAMRVRWTLRKERLALPHMPATGASGLDLYVKTSSGTWRWLANARPTNFPKNEVALFQDLRVEMREFMLYFPLYNGVTECAIGTRSSRKVDGKREPFMIAPATPRPAKNATPIVFFGTSITQGCCASRPGMVHTAILGRRLNVPIINLGFDGHGRLQLPIAKLMAEIDARLYVIDCLPNLKAPQVLERLLPFIQALREKKPRTPILLVEDRSYTNAFLRRDLQRRNANSRIALSEIYAKLIRQGAKSIHYLRARGLLGDDGEATVDGSHPTDLGFLRQAGAFENKIRAILPLK